jgi:hypothetical protein
MSKCPLSRRSCTHQEIKCPFSKRYCTPRKSRSPLSRRYLTKRYITKVKVLSKVGCTHRKQYLQTLAASGTIPAHITSSTYSRSSGYSTYPKSKCPLTQQKVPYSSQTVPTYSRQTVQYTSQAVPTYPRQTVQYTSQAVNTLAVGGTAHITRVNILSAGGTVHLARHSGRYVPYILHSSA